MKPKKLTRAIVAFTSDKMCEMEVHKERRCGSVYLGVVVLGVLECTWDVYMNVSSGFDDTGTEYWNSFCMLFTVRARLYSKTRKCGFKDFIKRASFRSPLPGARNCHVIVSRRFYRPVYF